jgi:hypothetical protein
LGSVPVTVTQLALPALTPGALYSVELQAVNGAGVVSLWVSITTVGEPIFQWAPYQIQAPSNDALFPGEYTFDLSQSYTPSSGLDWSASVQVTGVEPCNAFYAGVVAPTITPANVFVASTGGSIPGGSTLFLSIAATNPNGITAPSIILQISIPVGTNTNKITLGDSYATCIGTFTGNPADTNVLIIAGKAYTFQATLTNVDGNVLIGVNLAATIQNLAAAVNLGPGAGSVYAAAMTANGSASISATTGTAVTAQALASGSTGNTLSASGIASWSNSVDGGNIGNFAGGASIVWPVNEIADVGGPPTETLTGYVIFAALNNQDLICAQQTGALTGIGSPPTGYTPTTFSLTGPIKRSTWGLPSSLYGLVRIKGALLIHGGVEGAEVDSISNNGSPPVYTITAAECIDVANIDNWTGRVLAIIGRNNASGPFVSFNIIGFDPTTGTFTVSEDPVAAGVDIGDAMVVCTLGVSNSGNQQVVTDPGLSNAQDLPTPHAGLVPNDPTLLGTTFLVIKGTSRGLTAHITGNGATSVNLDGPIPIDSTSVWVIMGRTWLYEQDSIAINNSNVFLPVNIQMDITNAVGGSVLVAGLNVGVNASGGAGGPLGTTGIEADLADAPVRMMFAWGAGMAEVYLGGVNDQLRTFYQMLPSDQFVEIDTTYNSITVQLPPESIVRAGTRWIKWVAGANIPIIQPTPGDQLEYGSPPNYQIFMGAVGDVYQVLPTNVQ